MKEVFSREEIITFLKDLISSRNYLDEEIYKWAYIEALNDAISVINTK